MRTVNDSPHAGCWEITHDYSTLTHKAFGVLEIRRISFLVCVNKHQVEWSGGRRECFDGLCGGTGDDVDLMDETCGSEVLGGYPDA
jgi:hypothetical protein